MANDLTVPVRRAVVDALGEIADVASAVGTRIYGPAVVAEPTWPFLRVEVSSIPKRASGLDGSTCDITVHTFAKGDDEAACGAIASAAVSGLERRTLPLTADTAARVYSIQWISTQIIPDGDEADAWHEITRLQGRVIS